MKIKISELTGAALDWAVAKCEGKSLPPYPGRSGVKECRINVSPAGHDVYAPSTDWSQGGPIIEREKIAVAYEPSLIYDDSCRWKALCAMSDRDHEYGPTPLIAAMRCFVASHLGEEVDVPEELLK